VVEYVSMNGAKARKQAITAKIPRKLFTLLKSKYKIVVTMIGREYMKRLAEMKIQAIFRIPPKVEYIASDALSSLIIRLNIQLIIMKTET
jgi:hypothetical protein